MSDNYRPDVFGRVEASWRTKPPSQQFVAYASLIECPDCNVNVFIEEDSEVDGLFIAKVAHDETCPWLTQHEQKET